MEALSFWSENVKPYLKAFAVYSLIFYGMSLVWLLIVLIPISVLSYLQWYNVQTYPEVYNWIMENSFLTGDDSERWLLDMLEAPQSCLGFLLIMIPFIGLLLFVSRNLLTKVEEMPRIMGKVRGFWMFQVGMIALSCLFILYGVSSDTNTKRDMNYSMYCLFWTYGAIATFYNIYFLYIGFGIVDDIKEQFKLNEEASVSDTKKVPI